MDSISVFSKYDGPIDGLNQEIARLPLLRFLAAAASSAHAPARMCRGYPNVCRKALFPPLYIYIE